MSKTLRQLWLPLAGALLCAAATALEPGATSQADERWEVWRADLDYLFEEIEKPDTLRPIFEVKDIDWKKVRKEYEERFAKLAKAAKKRNDENARTDEVEFYGLLHGLVGQLRDSHAHLEVDSAISTAWKAAQPVSFEAGIELLPGHHGVILVANTFAARGADSPLYQKGVRHEATVLESVNGTPAAEYFEERARRIFEDEGWQSSRSRAYIEALNDLKMAEGESLKLVFHTLDSPEKSLERYLEAPASKRAKEFKRLKWDSRKVSLHATECTKSRNARNFRFLALELPELTETTDPSIRYAKLPSGTGYVRYTAVSGKSSAGLQEACAALKDCSGMILDMRVNGGGGESGIAALNAKEGGWSHPVAVLIGPKAMSAAETELWTLREMREAGQCNARLFGRTTAGSSGAKAQFKLPSGFASGQFVIRHWHGGRSTIEGAGIEPDEVVDQDVVELSRGIDSCVRAAEAWLASQ